MVDRGYNFVVQHDLNQRILRYPTYSSSLLDLDLVVWHTLDGTGHWLLEDSRVCKSWEVVQRDWTVTNFTGRLGYLYALLWWDIVKHTLITRLKPLSSIKLMLPVRAVYFWKRTLLLCLESKYQRTSYSERLHSHRVQWRLRSTTWCHALSSSRLRIIVRKPHDLTKNELKMFWECN